MMWKDVDKNDIDLIKNNLKKNLLHIKGQVRYKYQLQWF